MQQPVRLSEQQMSAVLAASYPLPADRRTAFLIDIATELAGLPEIGDRALHRVAA
jgi:hypothetical protein